MGRYYDDDKRIMLDNLSLYYKWYKLEFEVIILSEYRV